MLHPSRGTTTLKKIKQSTYALTNQPTNQPVSMTFTNPSKTYCVWPWKTLTCKAESRKSHRRKVMSLEEVTTRRWVGWAWTSLSSWSWPKVCHKMKTSNIQWKWYTVVRVNEADINGSMKEPGRKVWKKNSFSSEFPSWISGVHHFGWDFYPCDCFLIPPQR